jgi:toxin HigB-1
VIKSFKHKGLKRFFYKNDISGINPNHTKRLKIILFRLNVAKIIDDMDVSGFRLHPYTNMKDTWSIDVSGNYRILFRFINGDVFLIDYLDPH